MKIRELKKFLEQFDDELDVILSKDAEGNNYSPLCDSYSLGNYKPDSTWSGEFHTEDDAKEMDWHDDYVENAIVLWPVN